jgi:hypothetical protein
VIVDRELGVALCQTHARDRCSTSFEKCGNRTPVQSQHATIPGPARGLGSTRMTGIILGWMSDLRPALSCATQVRAPGRALAARRAADGSDLTLGTDRHRWAGFARHPNVWQVAIRLPYGCWHPPNPSQGGRSRPQRPDPGPAPRTTADLSVIRVADHLTVETISWPGACSRFFGHRDRTFQRNRSFLWRDGSHRCRVNQSFPNMPFNAKRSILSRCAHRKSDVRFYCHRPQELLTSG